MAGTHGYGVFAAAYDRLTFNVGYSALADYLLLLFERHGHSRPGVLLDAACGTGSLALALAGRGVEVVGADVSADMLAIAAQKAAARSVSLRLLHQPLERLDLYRRVDGAVCTMDSLNHLTGERALYEALRRIALFIEPGGLFIFDVNTRYKHRRVLANRTFTYELPELYCVWQNRTKGDLTQITLDLFAGEGSGPYTRSTERFYERCWPKAVLLPLLQRAGLTPLAILGDRKLASPGPCAERVFYVTRRDEGN